MKAIRVLIAEDNTQDYTRLKTNFDEADDKELNFIIERESDGLVAYKRMKSEHFDIVILDNYLLRMNGEDIIKKIRRVKPHLPILATSSQCGDIQLASLLDSGASDIVSKGEHRSIFMARVKNLLRISNYIAPLKSKVLRFGKLEIETGDITTVRYAGKDIDLGPLDILILITLVENNGKFVATKEIERKVWNDSSSIPGRVSKHIRRMNPKFHAAGGPVQLIKSKRGLGYAITLV